MRRGSVALTGCLTLAGADDGCTAVVFFSCTLAASPSGVRLLLLTLGPGYSFLFALRLRLVSSDPELNSLTGLSEGAALYSQVRQVERHPKG